MSLFAAAPARLGLTIALLASLVMSVQGAGPARASETSAQRLAGADRIGTSVAIAQHQFPDDAETVYLARSDVFADALAAGVLTDGPTLLVPSCGDLPASVGEEIERLGPTTVIALGGEAAVCDDMLEQAANSRTTGRFGTDRVAGASRHETAARIAERAFPAGAEVVYIADSSSPDAVAGGSLTDGPILLVEGRSPTVPAATRAAIADLAPDTVVALGGSAVVSDATLADAASGRDSERLRGESRYVTATKISQREFGDGAIRVFLARGDVYADAVAAGSLTGGPVLLTPTCGELPPAVAAEIERLEVIEVYVIGGSGAVCDDIADAAAALGREGPAYLAGDVETIEDFRFGDVGRVSMDGHWYDRTPYGRHFNDYASTGSWSLAGRFVRLRGTLGIADVSYRSDGYVAVTVLADGVNIASEVVRYGEPVVVDLDVTGTNVLEIRAQTSNLEGGGSHYLGLGNFRVLTPTAVDKGADPRSRSVNDASYLDTDVPVAHGNFDEGPIEMDGEVYPRSFWDRRLPNQVTSQAFVLHRAFERVRATVGITDDSYAGVGQLEVRILLDGEEAETFQLAHGDTAELDLDVTGVLRFTVVLDSNDLSSELTFGLGTPRALTPGTADPEST